MEESWEKPYAKLFWVLAILAILGWITAQLLDSYNRDSLKTDTIHFFQHWVPVFVAMFVFGSLVHRWTKFRIWAVKSRRNMFAYQLVLWSAIYAPMVSISWKWTLSEGSLMVVCMATASTFSAEITSSRSNGA